MSLAIVIADTCHDKRVARFAVERTLGEIRVDECLLLSDEPFVPGARHVPVAPGASASRHVALALDDLPDWTGCDTNLLIRWDGFVIDGRRWRREFRDSDYIGAPWPHLAQMVGSGAFSLRSRRLLNAVQRLRRDDAERDDETAEDLQICFRYRAALQAQGLRFADAALAAAFACGRPAAAANWTTELAAAPIASDSFGFHGAHHFPLVLDEDEVLAQFDSMLPRMGRSARAWTLFVWQAWLQRHRDLGTRALAALGEIDAALWGQVAQSCLARGMSSRWMLAG